jgi:hypothetical protein
VDSHDKTIADQAIQALKLRRQLERGAISEREYATALSEAVVADAATASPANSHLDNLAGKACPEFGNAQNSQQEPRFVPPPETHQFGREPDWAVNPGQQRAFEIPYEAQYWNAKPTSSVLVTPGEERYLAMKCPGCTAHLRIYDRTKELQCPDCQQRVEVERIDCTIALVLVKAVSEQIQIAPEIVISEKKLFAEMAQLNAVRFVARTIGALCGGFFASAGIAEILTRNSAMGIEFLVCASTLVVTSVCIVRHTRKATEPLNPNTGPT